LLNQACAFYPLNVKISKAGRVKLQSAAGAKWPGRVLGEFLSLAESDRLDRLKMCSSGECQGVFFDRSKPGNRRWCSSAGCGNRQKTRDYRKRVKDAEPATQA
jgi:predicted RNA-binding Zn ribbon-like protein